MPLLVLFDPPFERFLAVEKIGARQLHFLLQQVLRAQEVAFQRLFVAPLGLPVLVEQPFYLVSLGFSLFLLPVPAPGLDVRDGGVGDPGGGAQRAL